MPAGCVQLIYHMDLADGEKIVADPRLAAVAFTGSREGGLKLKRIADQVGKPIFLEMSSINPVVLLPGALDEKGDSLVAEFSGSCLMGTGQFCTNPGLVIMMAGDETSSFIQKAVEKFESSPVGTLFSQAGESNLSASIDALQAAGAKLVVGGRPGGGDGHSYANTLLQISGGDFLRHADDLQQEAFGNASMFVVAENISQVSQIIDQLGGNLTGCIYSNSDGSDDTAYEQIAPRLQRRVGRLINDKMPTGVAVSPAMNHGGPFPATGNPGYTAVGIPGSLRRFAMLQCFDNVRHHRLPEILQDENPTGAWRNVDGHWTQESLCAVS